MKKHFLTLLPFLINLTIATTKMYGVLDACSLFTESSSLRHIDDLFCKFVTLHNKFYESFEELERRASILRANEEIAQELSLRDASGDYSAVHSPFGDLTQTEFQNNILFPIEDDSIDSFSFERFAHADWVPNTISDEVEAVNDVDGDNFDWVKLGKLTEIKNQGTLGTCWAFSAVTVIESQVAISSGRVEDLSVEQLVECANESNKTSGEADCAEFGGWPYLGFKYIEDFGGIYKNKDFPYCSGTLKKDSLEPGCFPCMPKSYDKLRCGDHSDLYCDKLTTLGQGEAQLCKAPGSLELVKVRDWRKLPQDENILKNILREEGPVSVAMSATILQFYHRGVVSLPFCSSSPRGLDHAVVLVGYGATERFFGGTLPFWKVRNSWGKNWGEEGYFRLKRGSGMCGINLRASIARV